MNHLHFTGVHHYPSGFTLDASLNLEARVTALFGPSGAGKTTVLSMIAGLIRPQSGRIQLGERVLEDTEHRVYVAPHHRRIAYVFQEPRLFPHLTVESNLRYGQRRRPATSQAIALDRVGEVLDIGRLLRRYPATLSGGECQRVALGRALLSGPELLLMDEPLASLDEPLAGRILIYLERLLNEWRIPTVYVSHRPEEVCRLAEWVVVLANGRVVDQGPVRETLARTTLREIPGMEGAVNVLRVEEVRIDEHGHRVGRIGPSRIRLPDTVDDVADTAWVRFQASDVMLLRQEMAGVSARNHLHGVIRQVAALRSGRVLVGIDVGQFLWAEVTPEAVEELRLADGVPIVCLLKTSAIRII